MKILMLTTPIPKHLEKIFPERRIHLGVAYIVSMLEREGYDVDFIDFHILRKPLPDILKLKYDYVGIHSTTVCFSETLKILERLRRFRKKGWNGKIIVGGPHTSVRLESIPDFVDYIVQGEGEYAVKDIIEEKVKSRVVHYPRINNLDELPRPAYHHFKKLPTCSWDYKMLGVKPIVTMNTSRGCPFACTFCSVPSIWGKKYTYHSAERIVEDIEYLMKNFNAKGIFFREDNFTLNKKRVFEFCNLILKKGIKIKWMCESRVDTLSYEMLSLMKRSGCELIYIGVEAGTQRLLDILKKGITIEQVKKVCELCHKIGIKIHTSFLTNIPHETPLDRKKISELIKEIKPTSFRINLYRAEPGSELYNYIMKNKLYKGISKEGILEL